MKIVDSFEREDLRFICDGLTKFNVMKSDNQFLKPEIEITLILKDEEGKTAGGIMCFNYLNCMLVDNIFIDEEYRGMGYGKELMDRAEKISKENGCTFSHLTTFDFTAYEFYKSIGYKEFGILEGFPNGYKQYFMKKEL